MYELDLDFVVNDPRVVGGIMAVEVAIVLQRLENLLINCSNCKSTWRSDEDINGW